MGKTEEGDPRGQKRQAQNAASGGGTAGSGGGGGGGSGRRQLRARSAQQRPLVDEHPLLDALLGGDEEEGSRPQGRVLDVPLMCRRVEKAAAAQPLAPAQPSDVTAAALAAAGLRQPLLVPAGAGGPGGAVATRAALGLRLPPAEQLTPQGLVAVLGAELEVPTIDVATQGSGPRLTLRQLADYLQAQQAQQQVGKARKRQAQQQPVQQGRLLNVVSLSLAGTALEDAICPPTAVQQLDLVSAVWPGGGGSAEGSAAGSSGDPQDEAQRPETLLYALMGPAGAFTDWHIDMGGSAVWYHVVSGLKVFLAAPPTPANLEAFEEWSTSGKQASSWLGDRLEGLVRFSVGTGDTLVLPSAWPHAVSTPEASVAVGGNFLHALDYGSIAECYRREQRLGVTPKFQFPLFRRLMWYAAESAVHRLRLCVRQGVPPSAAGMTAWEVEGLPALADLLGEWWRQQEQGGSRKAAGVPACISEPWELLEELQDCLDTIQQREREWGQAQAGAGAAVQARAAAGTAVQARAREQRGREAVGAHEDEEARWMDGELRAISQEQEGPPGQGSAEADHLGSPLLDALKDGATADDALPSPAYGGGQEGAQSPGVAAGAATDADIMTWAALAVFGSLGALDSSSASPGAALIKQQEPSPQQQPHLQPLPQQQQQQQQGAALQMVPQEAALQMVPQEAALQMVPLAEAGGGGDGSGDFGLMFFQQPPPQQPPQQQQQAAGDGSGSDAGTAAANGKQPRGRGSQKAAAQQQRQKPAQRRGRQQQQQRMVSDSEVSEEEPVSSDSGREEDGESSEEDEEWMEEASSKGKAKAKGKAGSKGQPPARRRLRKAGADTTVPATAAAAPGSKRQRTAGGQASRGAPGAAAESPAAPSSAGPAAAKGRAASAKEARAAAAATAAAPPPAPPPPADLQPLGRKHTLGYTISLSRKRPGLQPPGQAPGRQQQQQQQPGLAPGRQQPQPPGQATGRRQQPPEQATGRQQPQALGQATGRQQQQPGAPSGAGAAEGQQQAPAAAPAAAHPSEQEQQAGAGPGAVRPAWRRISAPTPASGAASEAARDAAWQQPQQHGSGYTPRRAGAQVPLSRGGPREQERQRQAAEELLTELQQLQAVVKREEDLLARVQSGMVSLPDGGSKLAASLAQRKEALKRKSDAAAGRVLTYRDVETGAVQGPFSVPQLQQLLRAGVVGRTTPVEHPQRGTMPLAEALLLPEPLSAQLLREREQQQQRQQQWGQHRLPGGHPGQPGPHGGGMQGPPYDSPRWGGRGRGRWGGRGGRRSWEEEQRQREWEEQQRFEAEAAAAAAEQEASGMWCFPNERREMEGPYTVAELRDLHKKGVLTEDIMVHEEEQGVSVRLYQLLGYTGLAEMSQRQREEEAARARQQAAAAAVAEQAAAAAREAAAQQEAAAAAAAAGGAAGAAAAAAQAGDDWDDALDGGGGGGGGGDSPYQPSPAVGGDGLYEPSPAYSPPPSAPSHAASAPELYSPSRADWDDDDEEQQEAQQEGREMEGSQAGEPAPPLPQQQQPPLPQQPQLQGLPLPGGSFVKVPGDYPAGFAPRAALSTDAPGSPANMEVEEEAAAGAGAGDGAYTDGAGLAEEEPPPPPPPPPLQSAAPPAEIAGTAGAPAPATATLGLITSEASVGLAAHQYAQPATLPPPIAVRLPAVQLAVPSASPTAAGTPGSWPSATPTGQPDAASTAYFAAPSAAAALPWARQQQQQQQQPAGFAAAATVTSPVASPTATSGGALLQAPWQQQPQQPSPPPQQQQQQQQKMMTTAQGDPQWQGSQHGSQPAGPPLLQTQPQQQAQQAQQTPWNGSMPLEPTAGSTRSQHVASAVAAFEQEVARLQQGQGHAQGVGMLQEQLSQQPQQQGQHFPQQATVQQFPQAAAMQTSALLQQAAVQQQLVGLQHLLQLPAMQQALMQQQAMQQQQRQPSQLAGVQHQPMQQMAMWQQQPMQQQQPMWQQTQQRQPAQAPSAAAVTANVSDERQQRQAYLLRLQQQEQERAQQQQQQQAEQQRQQAAPGGESELLGGALFFAATAQPAGLQQQLGSARDALQGQQHAQAGRWQQTQQGGGQHMQQAQQGQWQQQVQAQAWQEQEQEQASGMPQGQGGQQGGASAPSYGWRSGRAQQQQQQRRPYY